MERNTWGGERKWYESEECESEMLIRDTGRFKLKCYKSLMKKNIGLKCVKKVR